MKIVINSTYRDNGGGAGSPMSKRVYFSFINKQVDGYNILHPSYFCRNLLTDWLYNRKDTPTLPHPDKGITRLFIHAPKEDISRILRNIKHIHSFEEEAALPLSKFIKYDDNGIIVEGSLWWQTACWKISLYTFLLKKLSYVKATPWRKAYNEVQYTREIGHNYSLLTSNMKNRKEINKRNTPNMERKYRYWWFPSGAGFHSVLSIPLHPQKKVMLDYQAKHLKTGK